MWSNVYQVLLCQRLVGVPWLDLRSSEMEMTCMVAGPSEILSSDLLQEALGRNKLLEPSISLLTFLSVALEQSCGRDSCLRTGAKRKQQRVQWVILVRITAISPSDSPDLYFHLSRKGVG